jgi:hypothetical protein
MTVPDAASVFQFVIKVTILLAGPLSTVAGCKHVQTKALRLLQITFNSRKQIGASPNDFHFIFFI